MDLSTLPIADRAAALFLSPVSAYRPVDPDAVNRAIADVVRQRGVRGCTADLASAYGNNPESAAERMRWALIAVGTPGPDPPIVPSAFVQA